MNIVANKKTNGTATTIAHKSRRSSAIRNKLPRANNETRSPTQKPYFKVTTSDSKFSLLMLKFANNIVIKLNTMAKDDTKR
mmetsp:Transcript_3762/g.5669  ORF Transcript_3762/g.5669 Transcript_3762/m.5669 type:complete len:81 (-) Transcript_3762:255-497(-)